MTLLNKAKIQALSKVHSPYCISIYMTTHQYGQEVLKSVDSLLLKNQLADIKNKLVNRGLKENDIHKLVEPIEKLTGHKEFWRNRSKGLAIYLSNDHFEMISLPITFQDKAYLSTNYILTPLLQIFEGLHQFNILSLQLERSHLYRCDAYHIKKVDTSEYFPNSILDVVGEDHKQKTLQYHSSAAKGQELSYHGHGEGKDDRKKEIAKFFHAIDKGLDKALENDSNPLVIVALEPHLGIFKAIASQKHCQHFISFNPSDLDELSLHQKAWDRIKPFFQEERNHKVELFNQFRDTKKTSHDLNEIVPSALSGKIDTLFLENESETWGIYDPIDRILKISDKEDIPNVSLTNLAAISTMLQGGDVYFMHPDNMPDFYSEINALYRY